MTWAAKEDLYARFGQEFINKLAIRRNYDEETESYVASEDDESIENVLNTALEDAKTLILGKLSCKFANFQIVNTMDFPSIKQWHIKMTIEVLKQGGDCTACDCTKLDEFLCTNICTEDGFCLTSIKSFISVSKPHFPCEACKGDCKCC